MQDYSQVAKSLKAAGLSWDTSHNGKLMSSEPHVKQLCSISLYYMHSCFKALCKNNQRLFNQKSTSHPLYKIIPNF